MGRAKGKVPVTIYLPEKLWQNVRELAPTLPTGKKKVSDLMIRLLMLGLEAYGAEPREGPEKAKSDAAGPQELGEGKKLLEVEVEGVKLFLKPVG